MQCGRFLGDLSQVGGRQTTKVLASEGANSDESKKSVESGRRS